MQTTETGQTEARARRGPSNVTVDHVVRRVMFAAGVGVLVLVAFVAKFDYLSDVNAIDYAQIARNLAEGRGFTTSVVTPLALATGMSATQTPDASRQPLYVLALALAMRVGGATDRAVVFVSLLLLLLTFILVYLISRTCFGDGVGIFAVAICALSPGLLTQAISGLDTTLLAFLVTLLFGLLLLHRRAADPAAIHWPLLCGLLLGLCYLVRFEAVALVPAVLLYWAFTGQKRRWRGVLLALATFVVVALPWVIRTALVTGRIAASPGGYELAMGTVRYPGQDLYRQYLDVPHLPIALVADHPFQMLRKLNQGLQADYSGFPNLINPYVLAPFLAGLLVPAIRRRYSVVQWCLIAAIVLMAGTMSVYTNTPRLLLAFMPLAAMLATAGLVSLLEEWTAGRGELSSPQLNRLLRLAALWGWALLVSYPMANYLFVSRPAKQAPVVTVVREVGQQGDSIVTDVPWHVAWYGQKRALLLPVSLLHFEALQKAGVKPDTFYLSPNVPPPTVGARLTEWQALLYANAKLTNYTRSRSWQYAGGLWKSNATTAPKRP